MNVVKRILFVCLLGAGIFYIIQGEVGSKEVVSNVKGWVTEKEISHVPKVSPDFLTDKSTKTGVFGWIGESSDVLREEKGEPIRKDLSRYGYTWWTYQDGNSKYIQYGVMEDKVVTVYATGDNEQHFDPIQIGTSYQQLEEEYGFDDYVVFSTYTFKLTTEDTKTMPLEQINDNLFIQFYFDSYTETLSSFRLMTEDVLLLQRPYEISYRGTLPEEPFVSEQDWASISSGSEQQIYAITNVMRNRFDQNPLVWNQDVHEIAFNHSKDMEENNYFSHYSQSGASLKERLLVNQTVYKSAGENIAAQYVDGPATVEGWLNSEGHRQALLKEGYTDLGVGVYRDYYTQNFLEK